MTNNDRPSGSAASPQLPASSDLKRFAAPVVVVALAALAPVALGDYALRVGTVVLMYVALAQAWNLVGGYAGLLSLAHPAFFGTGALAMAVMVINGVPLMLAAALAMMISVVVALLVAVPTLRLRGHYFVIGTLLVAEGVRNLVINLNFSNWNFRGGIAVNILSSTGLDSLSSSEYNLLFYFLMLAMAALATFIVVGLDYSRWGAALRAFRDDRTAAAAVGVPATALLIVIFVISAALTSLTGSVWAAWLGVIEANEAYALKLTFMIVVIVFLGGKGTVWGPMIGAVIMLLLDEVIGVEFAEYTFLTSGIIVIAIVLFLPDGLVRLLREGPKAISPASLRANYRRYRVS